jgi:hypothetical protein
MTRLGLLCGVLVVVLAAAVVGCSRNAEPPIIDSGPVDPIDQQLEIGLGIYISQCQVCHLDGDAGDRAPDLRSVVETFPECSDQNDFVRIGSEEWPDATYGATQRPIGEYDLVMPGYEFVLEPDEIAAVNLWTRAELADEPVADAAASCGVGGE